MHQATKEQFSLIDQGKGQSV